MMIHHVPLPPGFIDVDPEYFDHPGLRIATTLEDVDISIPHHKKRKVRIYVGRRNVLCDSI
jgi:hypothetical protein